jgi:hypothetical protein
MSIYNRAKNKNGQWRYTRVAVRRGMKTGDLRAPFYTRVTRDGKQSWQSWLAQTFKEAQDEVAVMRPPLTSSPGYHPHGNAEVLHSPSRSERKTGVMKDSDSPSDTM